MTAPLSQETILGGLKENAKGWILREAESGKYVVIPHPDYPERNITHFFLNPKQAEDVMQRVREASPKLKDRKLVVEEVKLLQTCRDIAAEKDSKHEDGFVVHPHNEAWEFLNED
jgi:hypothetical protein